MLLEQDPKKRCNSEGAIKVINSQNMDLDQEIVEDQFLKSPSKIMDEGIRQSGFFNEVIKDATSTSINEINDSKIKKPTNEYESCDEIDEDYLILQKIMNTLPQEYQAEIDNKVSNQLHQIEENYEVNIYRSGNRFQGEKLEEFFEENLQDDPKSQIKKKMIIPHGWGIFWWANGERFEGQFSKGKYHGEGIYYWPTGVKHYGEFMNGEISGLGVRYYNDGGSYFGQWLKGKNHGKGTYSWQTGAKYTGGFIEDLIYGKGVLVWPDETTAGKTVRKYEGLWKDDGERGITVQKLEEVMKKMKK